MARKTREGRFAPKTEHFATLIIEACKVLNADTQKIITDAVWGLRTEAYHEGMASGMNLYDRLREATFESERSEW